MSGRRLCWIGTYERDYPRAQVLRLGLRELGAEVVEVHERAWDARPDHAAALGSRRNSFRLGAKWLGAWARIVPRIHKIGRVDAVVAGYPAQLDAPPAWLVSRALRAPLVVDMMVSLSDTFAGDRGLVGNVGKRVFSTVDRLTLMASDVAITDTVANADWMSRRFRIPRSRFKVVPVGADPTAFPKTAPPEGPPTALFYGKLAPLHGIETIVRAAREPGTPPIRMIGTGQLSDWLARELERRPVAGLRHTPWMDYELLGAEVSRAAICLGIFGTSDKASRVVPNKVFQAMAAGRPVITADTPGIREAITDGVHGLLVPPGDAGALADALRRLASNPAARHRMGQAAHDQFHRVADPVTVATAFLDAIADLPA